MTRLSSLTGKSNFKLRRMRGSESSSRKSKLVCVGLFLITLLVLGPPFFHQSTPSSAGRESSAVGVAAEAPVNTKSNNSTSSSTGSSAVKAAVQITKTGASPAKSTSAAEAAHPSDETTMTKSTSTTSLLSYRKVKDGKIKGHSRDYDYLIFEAYDKKTDQIISMRKWAAEMAANAEDDLAKDITKLITDLPYQGLFFETPGASMDNAGSKPFQFCIVDGEPLADFAEKRASPKAFAQHFNNCPDNEFACQFPSLHKDALLVSPKKSPTIQDDVTYSHLVVFLRGAPEEQIVAVWKKLATIYSGLLESRPKDKPVWFSTAGEGVPWLHFRFDDSPKYYRYFPFAHSK